jgi:hypothetical protein
MNITGYHIDASAREDMISLWSDKSYWRKQAAAEVPRIIGVVHKTNLRVWPDSMNISDNILLAHYQRERR